MSAPERTNSTPSEEQQNWNPYGINPQVISFFFLKFSNSHLDFPNFPYVESSRKSRTKIFQNLPGNLKTIFYVCFKDYLKLKNAPLRDHSGYSNIFLYMIEKSLGNGRFCIIC